MGGYAVQRDEPWDAVRIGSHAMRMRCPWDGTANEHEAGPTTPPTASATQTLDRRGPRSRGGGGLRLVPAEEDTGHSTIRTRGPAIRCGAGRRSRGTEHLE